ncbi:MAG: biotin--[acetyl-CoA-carboxylase] ligase [Lachnospiraceae bacterium]
MSKLEVLTALRGAQEEFISGQALCEKLGVSRTAIWKAVRQLEKEGYQIEAVQNRGYRLKGVPDSITENELSSIQKTKWLGKQIYYYDSIDSTNTEAKRLAEEGAPHGALVIANEQTSGRGRRGRDFHSQSGTGIFMTFLLRPEIEPEYASMLTLVAAMAGAEGVKQATGIDTQIKWPNDLVCNQKKVCGMLTEMSAQIGYVNYVVVGIGLNVQNDSFPKEIADMATSLYLETGVHYSRSKIVEAIMEQFEHYYDLFLQTKDLSLFVEDYNMRLVSRQKEVKVLDPREPYEGKALGMNEKGEFLVQTKEGQRAVSSGEVSVRGIYGYV